MMLHLKKITLSFYSILFLNIQILYIFLKQEYFAYRAKKITWDHALSLTYRLFVIYLYPAYKLLLSFVYTVIVEVQFIKIFIKTILSNNKLIVDILRVIYIKLALFYSDFVGKTAEYQYSLFWYICLWVVVGFTIRLIIF